MILSLDASTKSTGYAIFDEDKLNPSLTNDFSLEFCYN